MSLRNCHCYQQHTLKRFSLVWILVVTALFFAFGQPRIYADVVWQGKVVGVSDGDTITVMNHGRGERIRLYGIDCPEKRQAFGKRAKQFTSDMVFGKNVEVRPVTTDRYGRTVAWVYVNRTCLNEELLKAGLAWHYKRYSTERHLAQLENEARAARTGLWSDPHAIPPWDFRRGKTSVTSARSRLFTAERKSLRLDMFLAGHVNLGERGRGGSGTKT